jgi:hypothetical protein
MRGPLDFGVPRTVPRLSRWQEMSETELTAIDESEAGAPPAPFPGLYEFLFRSPLYARYSIGDYPWVDGVEDLLSDRFVIDGHCPECERDATFSRASDPSSIERLLSGGRLVDRLFSLSIQCARKEHMIRFFYLHEDGVLQKVGQFPSLADIALDELRDYKPLLKEDNGRELKRAIGLAAHGVGIGSFIYLRRVFERLVFTAFENGKSKHGWTAADFEVRRMVERIKMVAPELPDFLTEHAEVYGILSKAVHELTEQECLAYFEPVKSAILLILKQARERKKKEEMTTELSASIKAIANAVKPRAAT